MTVIHALQRTREKSNNPANLSQDTLAHSLRHKLHTAELRVGGLPTSWRSLGGADYSRGDQVIIGDSAA